MVDAIALALIPFVQTGLSFWASIGSLIAVMVVLTSPSRLEFGRQGASARRLGVAALMMAPLLANLDTTMTEVVRVGREIVFFLLMTTFFAAKSSVSPARFVILERVALAVMGCMACLVALQIYYISRAQYFGIPQEWFIGNEGTLPGELDLIWGSYYGYLRPIGTFAEPSYLGFVCLSLGLAFLPLFSTSLNSRIILGLVCLIALMARSASFMVALACLFGPFFLRRSMLSLGRVALIGVALLAALLASGSIQETVVRLLSIGDETLEASGFVRLIGPALIMPEYLTQHPFGVPFTKLEPALRSIVGPLSDPYGDNALWGLLYAYGFLGPVVLFAVLKAAPDGMTRIYVLLCMQFNGLFFGVDKFAIMSVCLGIYGRAKEFAEANRGPANRGSSTGRLRYRHSRGASLNVNGIYG